MTHPFDRYLAGEISAPVAVARLLLDGETPESVAKAAAVRRCDSDRWRALDTLVGRSDALTRTAAVVASDGFDHVDVGADPQAALGVIAAAFDRLVRVSPELSVASYSLGDPAILEAASAEILDWLKAQDLVRPSAEVLDLGCGIGRIEAALARHCTSIIAVDVSPAMIDEAHRRCAAPNVRFQVVDGRDLTEFPTAAFDLVLAVDSFPYLVQAGGGIAPRHIAEAARVLRPGGALVILNFSYRSLREDIADAQPWSAAAGLSIRMLGETPFTLWDGAAFVFDKPS